MFNLKDWLKGSTKGTENNKVHNVENDTVPTLTKKLKLDTEAKSAERRSESEIQDKDKDDELEVLQLLTKEQLEKLKSNHSWLVVEKKGFGCSVCKQVNNLGIFADKNLRISKVWVDCSVFYNGTTKESQQSSLRKKIYEHRNSDAHNKATEIVEKSTKKSIDNAVASMHKQQFLTTEKVFRTVYRIVKYQRPFVDFPVDIDLQKLNGLSLGNILHSDKTCCSIAVHISSEMKKKICYEIISSQKKISVLIDESTALSRSSALVVVLRTFFADFPGDAYVFNLDLIELSNASANNIYSQLLDCLNKHGFDESYLNKCFIGFACDGASVMLGKSSGVATLLKNKFPHLIIWHCSNHRLELAVNDTIKEVDGINNFTIFIDKLYSLYHQSPKNQRELKELCASLDIQLLKIGKIFSVRWVSSSKRTINAVLNNYVALFEHFIKASNDLTREEQEKTKYKGLQRMLTSMAFVKNLHIMADALDELADLSLFLQRRNITLIEADKAMKTTIRVFDSMASDHGPRLSSVVSALDIKNFKGVSLHEEGKIKMLNENQFFRSLANNLRNRMPTNIAARVSQNEKKRSELDNAYYNDLLRNLAILDPKTWPKNDNDEVVDIRYGEESIRSLCDAFQLNDEVDIIRGFRHFKMTDGNEIPEDLKPLFKAVATIPISTSECERNFSSMNEIMTPLRCSLSIATVAALLFINSVGPPLIQFRPEEYVRTWLLKGHHLADDTNSRKREVKNDTTYEFIWKLL